MTTINKGNPVVLNEKFLRLFAGNLEPGRIYHAEDITLTSENSVSPRSPITESDFVHDDSVPYPQNGVVTTIRELMGSDRLIRINSHYLLSAAWFRLATADEVSRHARSIL